MKKILLALMMMCSMCAVAQDVIVKTDGSTIVCRVQNLTTTEVVYKKWSNLKGPNYAINRSEVSLKKCCDVTCWKESIFSWESK